MNMKLTFWLIAASLGLVSAGLVDQTQRYFFGYGDVLSRDFDAETFNVEKMKGEIDADFSKCNTDGTDGVTWDEVSDCKKENPAIIWSREQFDSGDTNDDEIVTLRELYVDLCKFWEPKYELDFYLEIQEAFDC